MTNLKRVFINSIIVFLITIAILSSCDNSTDNSNIDYINQMNVVRDTSYSEKIIATLNFQVIDYLEISKKNQKKIFLKYTPEFLFDCVISEESDLAEKYDKESFFSMLFANAIDQKIEQNKQMKTNNYNIKNRIDENIRTYCNDSILFANLENITYLYKDKEKRDSVISYFVCLSKDTGENWTFLDKDGCRDLLTCHFSEEISNYIMKK